MTSQTSSWQGKACVVTGGTGFIGSHLCARLHDLGAKVINVDIEPCHKGTLFSILNESRDIPVITEDLSQTHSIEAVKETKPDVIFHLAADPYGPSTTKYPAEAYRSNVVSTMNMLEVARQADVEHFILASSACYFGAAQVSPLCEDSEVSFPEHYYTYTKRQAENLVKSYNEFYAVPSAICRFVNVYGPGDRHMGRIIPQVCRQLIADKANTLKLLRSYGQSTFEFLHVEDAVNGLLAAGSEQSGNLEVYHFGPGGQARLRILDLVAKLSELYDKTVREITVQCATSERKVRKYLDTTRTRTALCWNAEWELDNGLLHTLNWYKDNLINMTPHKYPMVSTIHSNHAAR